jgi:hypothetical protein
MSERAPPTKEDVISYLRDRRNWGRWGKDDQLGTMNLITPEKRVKAASLVKTGRSVSLSRPFPKDPAPNNHNPAQHYMRMMEQPSGRGGSVDFYGIFYHGRSSTHLDSLAHIWDNDGMWQGRVPTEEVSSEGSTWCGVQHWSGGVVTKGVLLDIPKLRGEPYVTLEKPVHGWELEAAAKAQGVTVEPGDAVAVYCGREAWDRDGNPLWGSIASTRPGLHASCLPFLRDNDAGVLIWDMLDHMPNEYGLMWTVHGAIFSYGLTLVDNALLEPLAGVCAEEGRYEFMFIVAPWVVVGGSGSPANPTALF